MRNKVYIKPLDLSKKCLSKMTSGEKTKDLIKNTLSKYPNIWYPKNNKVNLDSFLDLKGFVESNSKNLFNNLILKEIKQFDFNYNNSLYHFLLYFSPSPKFPFIYLSDNCIFFACFSKRKHNGLILSIPVFKSRKAALIDLKEFLYNGFFKKLLGKLEVKEVLVRDLDDKFINLLKKDYNTVFKIISLKELYYATYNLKNTLSLNGNQFSNLRWHLNNFKKTGHKIEVVELKDNVKSVVHLIGKWRKFSIQQRNFSFIDVRSDKTAARFFGDIKNCNDFDDVIYRVLKVDDKVSSFNLGFPLGVVNNTNVFAHAVGICNINIAHLAEYSQYDFWNQIHKNNFVFVNDGPTWRESLEIYKNKFDPVEKKRFYWVKININK